MIVAINLGRHIGINLNASREDVYGGHLVAVYGRCRLLSALDRLIVRVCGGTQHAAPLSISWRPRVYVEESMPTIPKDSIRTFLGSLYVTAIGRGRTEIE